MILIICTLYKSDYNQNEDLIIIILKSQCKKWVEHIVVVQWGNCRNFLSPFICKISVKPAHFVLDYITLQCRLCSRIFLKRVWFHNFHTVHKIPWNRGRHGKSTIMCFVSKETYHVIKISNAWPTKSKKKGWKKNTTLALFTSYHWFWQ